MTKGNNKIQVMIEGGKKLGKILDTLLNFAKPGVSLIEIDKFAEKLIIDNDGTPSFKSVKDYKYATCLCLNDIVVHGIPTNYKLKEGDILGIDVGFYYKGFHTDAAWTIPIGSVSPEIKKFLQTGKLALSKAIEKATFGNRVWDISKAIEDVLKTAGFSPVRQLVGHGVGKSLHEVPQIPCFARGKRENSPKLYESQTLAIEIIYNMGSFPVVYKNDDGWSIKTEDNSLSSLFEHTILIRKDRPLVLTGGNKFAKI